MSGLPILVVEDSAPARDLLLRILESEGYPGVGAEDAAQARARLAEQEYSAIMIDVRMPGESGIDLLRHVCSNYPLTAPIMVTAVDEPWLVELALETGAYGYVVKPYRVNELLINLANALHRRELEARSRAYIRQLEATVLDRTRVLRDSLDPLRDGHVSSIAAQEVIHRLSDALAMRDEETGNHVRRMSEYAALLACAMGAPLGGGEVVRLASALHDVGKIGIPDAILQKPGPLTAQERASMQRHTVIGHDLLKGSQSPLLGLAASIALTHHERWDGAGYPLGLRGLDIPQEGRITAVADVFDALTSHRVYRPALSVEQTVDHMRGCRARHFDPDALDAFLGCMDQVLAVRGRYPEPRQVGVDAGVGA